MTRRRVIAGNWKMYKTLAETRAFFSAFCPQVANAQHCDIVVAPPFTAISTAVDSAKGTNVAIAARTFRGAKKALSPAKFPRTCWSRPAVAT